MSTSNSVGPELTRDSRLDAPFGKRLYDDAVVRKLRGVAKFKFWGVLLLIIVLTLLLEIQTSNRVLKYTVRAIEFENQNSKTQKDDDRIDIPSLVLHLPRQTNQWAAFRSRGSPISVINFMNTTDIPPGAEAKAVLLTGATNGLIKARLQEPLKVDGISLLDAGVLLLGQGRSTEARLYIDFKKAIFRDGKSISISAQAYELSDSILGLKGSRVGDATMKLAASAGLNFLSGMASGLGSPAYDQQGRPIKPSMDDAALSGLSKASAEQAKAYMEDIKNRPPMIEVKSGTVFTVTFDGGTQ